MNYHSLCFMIMLLLLLTIILFIFNKYNTNIETLENKDKTKKCESLGIDIDSKLNCPKTLSKSLMSDNILINFKNPPGLHAELDKLFIWRKLVNCCIVDFTYHENYIYGVGSNGKIYRVLKTGGEWIEYINTGWVHKIIIVNNYIYGIGKGNSTFKHKKDGTGNWQLVGQKGWQTIDMVSDNNYLYGIGIDYRINYIPLSGGVWKNYSPGFIFNIIIYKNKIYGIGMDHSVYTYPLIPPPIPSIPICKLYENTIWSFCEDNPFKKWGGSKKASIEEIKNCNYAASKDHFGKCPIVHNTKWEKLSNCCVTNIQGYNNYLYGTGTNGKIYRVSLNTGGKWEEFIKNGWVSKILVIDNNIYGIGKDKALYIHPIKEDKVEEFVNYISHSNSMNYSLT